MKKDVLKTFAKLTEKHQRRSLYFGKATGISVPSENS